MNYEIPYEVANKIPPEFANASRLDRRRYGCLPPVKWNNIKKYDGFKRFRRRVLGLRVSLLGAGIGGYKKKDTSIEELAQILYELGVCESAEKGREFVPTLSGREIMYFEEGLTGGGYVRFQLLYNQEGKGYYRIERRPREDIGVARPG